MKAMLVGVGLLSVMLLGGPTIKALACGEGGDKSKSVSDSKLPDLTTAELKKAMADGTLVFDARKAEDYKAGHIPGAKSLPLADVSEKALGDKKDQAMVFYCVEPKCPLSKEAAAKAVELGYTNVKTYEKGIKGWEADGEKVEKD